MLTGHCSHCHKIWTLEKRQGVCQWCGKLTTCQTNQAKPRQIKSSPKRSRRQAQTHDNGYDQLDGEWGEWLAVARRYEVKVPSQDRFDMRHTILIELAKCRSRDNQPIPLLRAYRIASLMIALYWREQAKHQVKVCIYSGLPSEPHCASCSHNGEQPCPYLALRPAQSLEGEVRDEEGYSTRLIDTIADDHSIDLEAWLDAKTWLLGCPMRLVQIALKRRNGLPLTDTEQRYFTRHRARELQKYQLKMSDF